MLIIRNTKGEKIIDLAINDLENVVGGGNALSCATGIGMSGAILAAASGPIGWGTFALLAVGAAATGFGTGYSCGAWYHTGD